MLKKGSCSLVTTTLEGVFLVNLQVHQPFGKEKKFVRE